MTRKKIPSSWQQTIPQQKKMLSLLSSALALVVGPNGMHTAVFTSSTLGNSAVPIGMPAKSPEARYTQMYPSGTQSPEENQHRDPTCFLAPGFAVEALGGAEVVASGAKVICQGSRCWLEEESSDAAGPGWLSAEAWR